MRVTSDLKRAISRTTRNHPALAHLHRHGVSITALAETLKEPRGTVSSWFAAGEYNRAIPLFHAEKIRSLYGVPLSAWGKVRGASDYGKAA